MTLFEKEQQIITWLKEYDYIKASIIYLNDSIEDIAEAGMGLQYDKDVISKTNKLSSVVENAAIVMDKLDITHKIKSMNNIIKAIDTSFMVLSDTEQSVILNRCVKDKYYYQFIHLICVSERTAVRIKREAIQKMIIVIFGIE